ncbi:MAG: hypothetical protein ACYCVS_15235 [Acidimicrobiales bacterium]
MRAQAEAEELSARNDEVGLLESCADPIERAVVAIFRYGMLGGIQRADYPISIAINVPSGLGDPVKAAWPNYNMDLRVPPWNGIEVSRWFAERANSLSLEPDTLVQVTKSVKGVLGGYKKRNVETGMAWRFPQGSNVESIRGTRPYLTAFIFSDGHYVHCGEGDFGDSQGNMFFQDASEGNLSVYALYQMGRLISERLGFPPYLDAQGRMMHSSLTTGWPPWPV